MLWIIAIAMSFFTWIMMGIDKWKAGRGKYRISEKTLFILAILFGATGGVVGMTMFRHKTQKKKFKWFFPVLMFIQLALLFILEGPLQ